MSLGDLTGSKRSKSKPDFSGMSLDDLTSSKSSKPDLSMSLDDLTSKKASKPKPKPSKNKGRDIGKPLYVKPAVVDAEFQPGDEVECRFTQRFRPAKVQEVH